MFPLETENVHLRERESRLTLFEGGRFPMTRFSLASPAAKGVF